MKQGWVSVHRQIQDHWLWGDKPFSQGQAWIDLIMLANYENKKMPYKGEVITCERGTVNLSISYLANRWGWSRKRAKNFLNLLESDGMVSTNATTHRTVITIENYSVYNDVPTTKSTTRVSTKEQQGYQQGYSKGSITNNINNINKYNNIYDADPRLDAAIKEFVTFRKKLKKPMTDHAVKLMIAKLNRLSTDIEEQVEILNQSILNGWQGIFPLKKNEKPSSKQMVGENGIEIDESKNDLDDLF